MRSIWSNFWSFTGAVVAVLAAVFFVSFQFIGLIMPTSNPYVGIWTFLVLPAVLVAGLLLIPLGYIRERNRRRKIQPEVEKWTRLPHFDLNNPKHRRGLLIFVLGTVVALPLIGMATYEGYHFTDSTQFCGEVCHSVMHPEFTAYSNSPHARVSCAACHIGPGANWYVKSKLSGVRQVIAVTLNTFSKPIPTPVENLRPARETCEQCHWPAKFYASQLRSRVHYASDEKNTRSEIRVLLNTGGGDSSMGPPSGIHWHMALSRKIEYVASDRARQVIPWVRATEPSGTQNVYRSDGIAGAEPPEGEIRTVDCMDCHNRPTHIIQAPDRTVNISLQTGRLDPSLPYIKKAAVDALVRNYSSDGEADRGIDAYIREFYRTQNGGTGVSEDLLAGTVREIQAIYHRNFFPSMRVDWRVYPDNIGHMMFEGCFRCHDGKHVDSRQQALSQDCSSCHQFLEPATGQSQMYRQGVPEHPIKLEGIHSQLKCSQCHTGGPAPERTCAGCHTAQTQFRQGTNPALPGLKGTPPSYMAGVECEQCHDVSKPQTPENLGAQCESCHEKGYGAMIQMWKDDAQARRANATGAIDGLEKSLGAGASNDQLRDLLVQMRAALAQVDKAGPHHNLDFAEAIYGQITSLAQNPAQKGDGNPQGK